MEKKWLWIILIISIFIIIIIIALVVFLLPEGEKPPPGPPPPPEPESPESETPEPEGPGYYYSTIIGGQKKWLNYFDDRLVLTFTKPRFKFTGEIREPLKYGDLFFAIGSGSMIFSVTDLGFLNPVVSALTPEGKVKLGTLGKCFMFSYATQESRSDIYLYPELSVKPHLGGGWEFRFCGNKQIYVALEEPILLLFDRSS